jgi:hypothetical protein
MESQVVAHKDKPYNASPNGISSSSLSISEVLAALGVHPNLVFVLPLLLGAESS